MRQRLNSALPIAIAVLAIVARSLPSPRTIDDAFITFRYARNLLDGAGFVYNPGEHVLGTTTPLYTLFMALISVITGSRDFPWLALGVNALADAATCVLLVRLGEKFSGQRSVGLAAGLLWAIAPLSVTFAIGGMETSVFILLMVLTADVYFRGHTRWAALTAALLLLTRPDGALFVGPLILDLVIRQLRQRRFPWAEAGVFSLTGLPWAIFAGVYFGSPLPHSIAAKLEAYRLPPGAAFVTLIQHYSTPFFESAVLGNYWQLVGLFVYVALSLIAALAAFRRNARAWPMAAYPWLYFLVFAIANPLIFRWYLAPPLPFYFILILSGLAKLMGDVGASLRRNSSNPALTSARVTPAALTLVTLFFGLTSLSDWVQHPNHGPDQPAPQTAWHQLELYYTQVGQSLAPRVNAQTVIAAGDVGALGYFSGARILDTVGLMSPEAVPYYPLDPALYAIVYAIPPQLILDRRPDYLVLLEVYGRKGLLADARFLAEYTLIEKIPTDIYGSDGLLIYQRKP